MNADMTPTEPISKVENALANDRGKVRVLITGGCGRIGTLLAQELGTKYAITLLDRVAPPATLPWPYIQADTSV